MKTTALLPRTLLVLATLGVVAGPASAGKRRSSAKKKATPADVARKTDKADKAKKPAPVAADPFADLDYGEAFDLSRLDRRSDLPRADVERAAAAVALSSSQVDRVIKGRQDDLEYCWLRLPAGTRAETSAVLKLAIEPSGAVTAASVTGELPAEAEQCLTEAAARWTFPGADVPSDVEYPISLSQ